MGSWQWYALAIAAALVAAAAEAALLRFGADTVFLTYFPAVAVAAAYGGFRGGAVATLAGALINLALFVSPDQNGALRPADQLVLALFLLVGLAVSTLTAGLRQAIRETQRRSEEQADRLAVARTERARAEALTRQGEAVAAIGQRALTGMPLLELMGEASLLVARTLEIPTVAVTRLDHASRSLSKVAGVGWPAGVIGSARVPLADDPLAGSALASDGAVVIDDFAVESRSGGSTGLHASARAAPRLPAHLLPDLRSGLGVRIGEARRPDGVLAAYSPRPRRFTADEAEFLSSVANVLAAAIARADAMDELGRSQEETERLYREADSRRAELTAVLAAIGEAVLLFDADDQLLLYNPATLDVFPEGPPPTLSGIRDALTPAGAEAGEQPAWTDHHQARHRDGRWIDVSTYRTTDDTGGSTILLLRDVTASRASQAARDAFMGLLSHELRTPITTIYGGTRLLDRPLAEEQRRELVNDVRVEAERLYRLVEDLLVMTRVERGSVEVSDEPILLQRVIPSVVSSEESNWPGLTVQVSMPAPLPAVRGELTYVEQVVRNLLTNAAKYGGGESVELVADDEGPEVVVRVLDRGPGITDEEAERLFDLFYRAEKTAGAASGAGIGLFVCRALVSAMGGRMWAAARPGGGSVFSFSLPVLEVDDVP